MEKEPTQGIESAATRLSYPEIEMMKSEPYRVVIRRLEELIMAPNAIYDRVVENFITELAGVDYNLSEKKLRGVWYNDKRKIYIAERNYNGKNRYITSSKDFTIALDAYLKFCEEKGIEP